MLHGAHRAESNVGCWLKTSVAAAAKITGYLALPLAICLSVLAPAGVAFAQSVNGLISGTVLDPQGAAIGGALVTVTDQLTTTSQSAKTKANGSFIFPEIRPGTYTLSVEYKGFERFEKVGILLLTADRLSVGNLIMKVGSDTQLVTVTAENAPVETTSSEQSSVISAVEMAALPVIGNDYMALTKTIPGSTYLGEGNGSLSNGSSQASFMGINQASARIHQHQRGLFEHQQRERRFYTYRAC